MRARRLSTVLPRGRCALVGVMGVTLAMAVLTAPANSHGEHPPPSNTAATRAGDWEASGAAKGSFVVNVVREREVYTSGPDAGTPVIVRTLQGGDLVLSLEERCRTSSAIVKARDTVSTPLFHFLISQTGTIDSSVTVIIPKVTVVVHGKTLTFPGGHAGTLRMIGTLGADSGQLTFSFGGHGGSGCTVPPTTFHARRGSRLAIKDGEWRGRAANGQPVLFGVEDGGRAIASPMATGIKDPAAYIEQVLSFAFGRFCTDDGMGGATCPTTTPSSTANGPLPQPCLHVSVSPALIGLTRNATLGLLDSNGTLLPTGPIKASVKLHFTSRTDATGTYTQPGDPGCSSRFTATAP